MVDFHENHQGGHAIEDDLHAIITNPVASITPKWRTFKLLRRMENRTSQRGTRKFIMSISARNGPVYAAIPYRKFFLFLNFILALINIYYIQLSLTSFLMVYLCFTFKMYTGTYKFPFRALMLIDLQRMNNF
jgi:hypothetical protein